MDAVDRPFYVCDYFFFDCVDDLALDVNLLLDDMLAVDRLAVHMARIDFDFHDVRDVSFNVVVNYVVNVNWHVDYGFDVVGDLVRDD